MGTRILLGLVQLVLGSVAEGPSAGARRLRELDPGGRNDFGGRFR